MTLIWHTNFKHITQSEAIPSGGCVEKKEEGGKEKPACAADNGIMDIMGAIRRPPRASRIF